MPPQACIRNLVWNSVKFILVLFAEGTQLIEDKNKSRWPGISNCSQFITFLIVFITFVNITHTRIWETGCKYLSEALLLLCLCKWWWWRLGELWIDGFIASLILFWFYCICWYVMNNMSHWSWSKHFTRPYMKEVCTQMKRVPYVILAAELWM